MNSISRCQVRRQCRVAWDVQLLWCPWSEVPCPVFNAEQKPPGRNGVGEELVEDFWCNPVDQLPRYGAGTKFDAYTQKEDSKTVHALCLLCALSSLLGTKVVPLVSSMPARCQCHCLSLGVALEGALADKGALSHSCVRFASRFP